MLNRSLVVATAAASLSLVASAQAIDVTLTAGDGFGNSSFNSAGNWSNGAAPSAGNDYFTGNFRVRTPADAGSYVFGGDSLTVNNTNPDADLVGLSYKGLGTTGVITVDNLILDGGSINHINGVGDLFQLDGNINVVSDSTIWAKQGPINILADVTGTGNVLVPVGDDAGRTLTLLGVNTLTGDIQADGEFVLGETGSYLFDIDGSGTNNTITGSASAVYNGTFVFDLDDASAAEGDSWTITSVATQSFGETFNVAGFTESGDVWTMGDYQFSESTGVLSVVVPEPTSLALVGLAGLAALRRRR